MLAAVRTVAVRNSMNHRFNYISKPIFGWKINLSVLLLSSFLSIFYYFRFEMMENGTFWTMPLNCPGYNPSYFVPNVIFQERDFYKASDGLFRNINLIIGGGIGKILPCILFPTLTIILIRELKKARLAREKAKKESIGGKRKELTTRLVIYMTVSFFAIEFPIGICFWVEAASSAFNEKSVATSIIQLLNMIYVVMTLSHFSICFFMSSQYRTTVKSIFQRENSIKNQTMSVVSVMQNARSGNSSNM
ncbi:Protein CBR-SRW-87 [Caenorhabditis briggsae]|uniref:Protein CBR-SRW-87 n=1 Tax=Caenorhabditis briggsae TaxID=6238 RepID=A8Y354_CAEBR|nr:Protein CBR-SRW-87 [Caenorhabditis briggsae]CAP39323.2 Protein CBR-SRW-87 [Caenorhabditis briggsae]